MTQTQFSIDPTEFPVNPELESIMKEQRDIAAQVLVDELNKKFFESVSTGLVDGQQITFHDKDVKSLGKNGLNSFGQNLTTSSTKIVLNSLSSGKRRKDLQNNAKGI